MSDELSLDKLDELIEIVEDNAWVGDTPLSSCVDKSSLKALDKLIGNVGKVDTIICTPDDWDRIKQLRQNNGFKFEYGWADRIYIPKEFNAVED